MTFLTEQQRRRLGASENVLWCGKSRPTFFLRGCKGRMVMGAFFAVALVWLYLVVIPEDFQWVWTDNTATLALLVTITLPVGLWPLLTPLSHWIRSSYAIWVVTNQRVIRFLGPFEKSWANSELMENVLPEKNKNGCYDFIFFREIVGTRHGDCVWKVGIENVPPEDARALAAVFRRLTEKKFDVANLARERVRRMADEFYKDSESRDIGSLPEVY